MMLSLNRATTLMYLFVDCLSYDILRRGCDLHFQLELELVGMNQEMFG